MRVADEVVIFAVFFSALGTFVLYTLWHNWWENLFGRALALLLLGVAAVLLRPVLYFLGLYTPGNTDALAFLSLVMMAATGVGILGICWTILRPHLRAAGTRINRRRHHHVSALPPRMMAAIPLLLTGAVIISPPGTVHHRRPAHSPERQASHAPALLSR